ncbi:hypothetical protein Tco_1444527, partial [Tanacetum coccineum]
AANVIMKLECIDEDGLVKMRDKARYGSTACWLLMEGQADGIYNIAVYHCIKILVDEPVAIP